MNTTLAEIVQKIASQGKNPDVSFLKDNPEAQTMLLMALLSSTNAANAANNNNNKNTTTAAPSKIDTDKRKYDSFNSANSSPCPTRDESEAPRRVGRKPVTSEEEDSDNPKSKRKAQNRAAQRAFRERKENYVRILEDQVKELEEKLDLEKNSALLVENEQLKNMIAKLQSENAALLGSSVSFDYPLSAVSSDENRPQKIIRSSAGITSTLSDASPVAYFDSLSSLSSSYSTSSKSRSNTPETQHQVQPSAITIDDILGLDTSILPSNALLDHSELLGLNNEKLDYSSQLDDILNQHRLTFATDPSQFDFFYPLEVTNNNDILNTASIQLPQQEQEEDEGEKHIKNITKVWDKVSEHPRFDEFDLDVLCDEMKKKAVCTEADHDKELEKVVNEYYPIIE